MTSRLTSLATAVAALLACSSVVATELQVAEIEIVNVNDGTTNGNAIYVRGSFSPALPCPTQGFIMFPSDPFLKEVMAMLLMAKSTGRPVSFANAYCHATGYGRGNGYVLK